MFGMSPRKRCGTCGRRRMFKFFAIRNQRTGLRQSMCRDCRSDYDRVRYQTLKERGRLVRKQDHLRNRNRRVAYDFLSTHPCVDCGETDLVVLEFDHLRDKEFNVSDGIRCCYSVERLLREIAKCEVVCANCHKRRTYAKLGSYRITFGE